MLNLDMSLSQLQGCTVLVRPNDQPPDPGEAPVQLIFENGTNLRATYWRLVVDDKAGTSSFDHGRKYGLPAPVDSIEELQNALKGKTVVGSLLDRKTGDLVFEFSQAIVLRVLNLTAFEVWEISFPDGTGEYSNFVK